MTRRGRSQQRRDRPRAGVSVKTVQDHVTRLLSKLQLRDRTQAALRARGL